MSDERAPAQAPSLAPIDVGVNLRQRLWQVAPALVVGLALLALVVRGVRLGSVWTAVRRAEPGWVGVGLLSVLLTTAAKVGRWAVLFPRSEGGPSYRSLARALVLGQLVNALLPARLGEVARVYALGRDEGGSEATGLGTIAAEKVFDVLFLFVTIGLAATLTSLPSWLKGSLMGVAGLGGAVLAAAIVVPERRVITVFEGIAQRLPDRLATGLTRGVEQAFAGLESLRNPWSAAATCAWSLVVWSLAASTNMVLFWAFHLSLSVGAALLLVSLLHIGTAPPSSPGRVGVFHAITVAGLARFGVNRSDGLAYATVLHAVVYVPQMVLGVLALVVGPGERGRRP